MSTLEEQLKNALADWQKRFEEMRVQFALGKMDAAEAFEQYKNELKKSVSGLKEHLDQAAAKTGDYSKDLGAKLEQLRLQLNLGKADGLDAFREQREKIEAALHEVYVTGKSLYNKQYHQVMDVFDSSSSAFKTGLEILQLQFSLAKMNAKDETEAIRKSIDEKMNELSGWYKESQADALKSMEEWGEAARQNMEKVREWTADFMKGFKK